MARPSRPEVPESSAQTHRATGPTTPPGQPADPAATIAALEHELAGHRRRLELVRKAAHTVIYVLELATLRVEWVNLPPSGALGHSGDELEGLAEPFFRRHLHPDELARLPELEARWRELADEAIVETEHRLRHKAGHWRTFLARDMVHTRDADGAPTHIIGTLVDVTMRRELQRLAARGAKLDAVARMTGQVALDFNNLLTVVIGSLQILARHVAKDPFATELAGAALKAARRGSELNRTLLAFSRKQRLAPVAVDCNEMIAHLTGMLRRVLGEHVSIGVAPAADLPRAIADAGQLETALLNLAVNARDAMPDGGTLTLETAAVTLDAHYAANEVDVKPGRYVMLAVSDTGCGMTPEVVARACEPFFTTKEVGKGSGLGLAMVYGFVKQSGGHVKIYSEPGFGTTIKLFLPEVVATTSIGEAEPATADELPIRGGDETLLVVEDEEDVRQLACRVLGGLGYRILQACDGRDAMVLIESDATIDLLFTDVVLPGGMNGPEIARRARLRRPGLKVMYTSGYTGNAIQQLDATLTPVHLITKPYAIDEMTRAVRALLDAD